MSMISAGAGDTIFALASGAGRGAISIIRISGPGVTSIMARMVRGKVVPPRRSSRRVLLGGNGAVLDHAIVLFMPGPGSYTGEDVAELHVHGGLAVVAAVSAALASFGARPAEPGEFTRRAFLSGRMDLLEAEGIADLIEAESESQRLQALRQIDGALYRRVSSWTSQLTRFLAYQEALIDFPEESIPEEVEAGLRNDIDAVASEMSEALSMAAVGERVREGLIFAMVGAPNVGKSSLVNRLARRDVAIVSTTPGTTRDVLEVPLSLGGIKVTLIDTAGLREASDPVEAEGVRRARHRAATADFVIGVVVPNGVPLMDTDLVVCNKIDIGYAPPDVLGVSALTGIGLDVLEDCLADNAAKLTNAGAHPVLTRQRHRSAIEAAHRSLCSARAQIVPELRAEELRLALQSLGRLTGAVESETVLDEIFAAFCIGK